MKNSRIMLVAALLSAAVASSAMAAGEVWWSTPGSVSEGPGQALVLDCNTTGVPPGTVRCEWLITVFYNADAGATGWMLNLQTDPNSQDKLHVKVGADSPVFGSNVLNQPTNNSIGGINTGGGHLFDDIGSGNLAGVPAATYALWQFRLSKVKFIGDVNSAFIFAGIGSAEFGGPQGPAASVQLGPNAPRDGSNIYELEPLPVIVIRNTPEPATISLLGLGLVALLRRRR